MEIIIREYITADQPILAHMFYDFTAYLRNIDPMKRIPTVEGYGEKWMAICLEKIEKNQGKIYIAEIDTKIVGFVMGIIRYQTDEDKLETIPTITGDILELYVDEIFRGNNIGTMLIQKMEEYFKHMKCDVSWLGVFEPNISAREFYRKHNYQERVRYLIKKL